MGALVTEAAEVVSLREVEPGIVQLTMEDRESKNTFSDPLMAGLVDSFRTIARSTTCKAVVLTGYGNYFNSGGTQDGLLRLSDGENKFTDLDLYSLALKCPVPVISAMQGHGIGGGFVMGLFADFVVLSRESIYTTNFMKYGFTPGMGATLVVPAKLGIALGEEMLLTARNFFGQELQARGVPFPVVPRAEVLEHAMQTARSLAAKPRHSLITLKNHLVRPLRERLPEVIEQELAMHEQTFHQPEVKQRIGELFGR